ncbi:leucine-rich repeat protein [bacterium]|nr:leucine-rich repeat protein [bacterium]
MLQEKSSSKKQDKYYKKNHPQKAFQGCLSRTSIRVPDSIIRIGDYAFANCKGLTEIPNSLEAIGNNAFSGCSNLSEGTKELLRRKYNYHDF